MEESELPKHSASIYTSQEEYALSVSFISLISFSFFLLYALPLRNQNHNEMAFAEEERMMKEAVRSGGGEIRCGDLWNAQNEFWEWVASGKRSWSLGGTLPNPGEYTVVTSLMEF